MISNAELAAADAPPPDLCATLLEHALFYARQGVPVFPASAGDRWHGKPAKQPLTAHGYKDASLDEAQIRRWWSRHPGAMIGLPLGNEARGLVVMDLDVEAGRTPLNEAIEIGVWEANFSGGLAALERAVAADHERPQARGCVMTPSGGMHIYFRAVQCPPKAARQGADFQSNGSYVIAAPSRLDDGRAYEFAGTMAADDLWGFFGNLDDIPSPPDWFYDPPEEFFPRKVKARQDAGRPAISPIRSSGDDPFRALNNAALADLDAWVPALQLPKTLRKGPGFRAVASFRPSSSGRPLERRAPNLSIHPTGIVDEGTSETFTPINLVMAAQRILQERMMDAARWLAERVGFDLADALAPETGPLIMLKTDAEKASAPDPELDALAASEADTGPLPARDDLEALCHPPGLVGDLMDWIDGSARQPCRALALGPALTFVAALAGRHNAGPTGLRPNLYAVTLAKSGFGKDHARKCVNDLVTVGGLERWLGPEEIMSDSGLREAVEQKPSSVCLIDEFGGLISKIMDRKAGQHQAGIRHMLLKLYTSSDSTYRGAAYAQRSATPIHNPCLSIYGTTTPHDFWPAMSAKGVGDGFLPRFLMLNIEGDPSKRVTPKGARVPDQSIVDRCRALVVPPGGNLVGVTGPVVPCEALWGAGAESAYDEADEECRRRAAASKSDSDVLWTRTMEQALKLAHIVALGVSPAGPVIVTKEMMIWGVALAMLSTRTFIGELNDRLASTDRQAEYLQVKRLIRSAGAEGITARVVGRKLNGALDTRRRDDILRQLIEDGHVVEQTVKPEGGGRPSARYFSR